MVGIFITRCPAQQRAHSPFLSEVFHANGSVLSHMLFKDTCLLLLSIRKSLKEKLQNLMGLHVQCRITL